MFRSSEVGANLVPSALAPSAMYWLKMCPRCQGDLQEHEDRFGKHVTCLQCGRTLDGRQQIALGIFVG